jgi:hypothetical protein
MKFSIFAISLSFSIFIHASEPSKSKLLGTISIEEIVVKKKQLWIRSFKIKNGISKSIIKKIESRTNKEIDKMISGEYCSNLEQGINCDINITPTFISEQFFAYATNETICPMSCSNHFVYHIFDLKLNREINFEKELKDELAFDRTMLKYYLQNKKITSLLSLSNPKAQIEHITDLFSFTYPLIGLTQDGFVVSLINQQNGGPLEDIVVPFNQFDSSIFKENSVFKNLIKTNSIAKDNLPFTYECEKEYFQFKSFCATNKTSLVMKKAWDLFNQYLFNHVDLIQNKITYFLDEYKLFIENLNQCSTSTNASNVEDCLLKKLNLRILKLQSTSDKSNHSTEFLNKDLGQIECKELTSQVRNVSFKNLNYVENPKSILLNDISEQLPIEVNLVISKGEYSSAHTYLVDLNLDGEDDLIIEHGEGSLVYFKDKETSLYHFAKEFNFIKFTENLEKLLEKNNEIPSIILINNQARLVTQYDPTGVFNKFSDLKLWHPTKDGMRPICHIYRNLNLLPSEKEFKKLKCENEEICNWAQANLPHFQHDEGLKSSFLKTSNIAIPNKNEFPQSTKDAESAKIFTGAFFDKDKSSSIILTKEKTKKFPASWVSISWTPYNFLIGNKEKFEKCEDLELRIMKDFVSLQNRDETFSLKDYRYKTNCSFLQIVSPEIAITIEKWKDKNPLWIFYDKGERIGLPQISIFQYRPIIPDEKKIQQAKANCDFFNVCNPLPTKQLKFVGEFVEFPKIELEFY